MAMHSEVVVDTSPIEAPKIVIERKDDVLNDSESAADED